MEKLIIGITGLHATGKDTGANYLKTKGFVHVSLSQIIRVEARRRGMSSSRNEFLKLGNLLRRERGPGVLAELALERVGAKDKIVITGIRAVGEVKHLRKSGRFVLVELIADPEVRLKRLKKRGRKDERSITVDEMLRREQLENSNDPNAMQLHKVIAMADKVIDDNGSKEALYKRLEAFLKTI
ncbi:AAA family ATPase [Candidatus Berkelbacteria bacterium]|nr:AAA family ATPase [Candidatus Berkelbacteria bacterium]